MVKILTGKDWKKTVKNDRKNEMERVKNGKACKKVEKGSYRREPQVIKLLKVNVLCVQKSVSITWRRPKN